jgi:FAD/FMN-containing dehydrogenase
MKPEMLASWGRYPAYPQTPHASYWRGSLAHDLAALRQTHGSTLAFGNGRSYGDSCLAASDHVMHMRPLNRFISADWQNGVLVAEAGLTHEEILELAVPRGWFLPVTPGTRYVTLGGALANDVHGKNHHVRGTFGRHVRRFGLVRSDRSSFVCSPLEHPEFFAATIGGLGLTGLVDWVELQLMRIGSAAIDTVAIRFSGLRDFFALSAELDGAHEYTVAWVDCMASGDNAGRGVFTAGDHASDGNFAIRASRELKLPFTLPVSVVNRYTLRMFNAMYYRLHAEGRRSSAMSYASFLYPLDRIRNWNRAYGAKGFQQYQCVIPDQYAEPAMRDLLQVIAASGNGSILAVLKNCGNPASPGLLSFPMAGVSLALDFPQNDALARDLFPRLDSIVREARGRLYPAKDAHMSGADFRSFYPGWQKLDALRDPALCSRFWQRVTGE